MARPTSPRELQEKILAFVGMLEPKAAVGCDKIRLGRNFDGGYIFLDDFTAVDVALSFGVSDDASWDLDVARRNIRVHQFDHTINRAPSEHPHITFHKTAIGPEDAQNCVSLDTLALRYLLRARCALLKIDIEGNEWPVFNAASVETLGKFSQIACEFHGFNLLTSADRYRFMVRVIAKLKSVFQVVHVHGNNAGPLVNLGGLVLPNLLEVTFANRRHYRFAETNEVFPTPLDQPNLPQFPDLDLGRFKFSPTSVQAQPAALSRLLNQAVAFHQKGHLPPAETLYLQILDAQPDHFDARHLLAVLRHQQGRDEEGR